MSKRNPKVIIKDILMAIESINEYIEGFDYKKFTASKITKDAVIRNLEIIGEASKLIPEEYRNKYNAIKWKNIIGLRNKVIHEYFGVDDSIIWNIITNDIPNFTIQIKKIYEEINNQE